MQFNFFEFVRDGVKQAVLLGVSDAVEHIGTPLNGEEIQDRLNEGMPARLTAGSSRGGSKRKRLGRSLKEIETSVD